MSSSDTWDVVGYDPTQHKHFCLDAYLKGTKKATIPHHATDRQYYDFAEPLFTALLSHPDTDTLIVTPRDMPDTYAGYIVARKPMGSWAGCLDYLYVKRAYRGLGAAKELTRRLPWDFYSIGEYSYPTNVRQRRLLDALGLVYNPYSMYTTVGGSRYEQNWEKLV